MQNKEYIVLDVRIPHNSWLFLLLLTLLALCAFLILAFTLLSHVRLQF